MAEQTLLVTGGCGYLGSQLIRDLARDAQWAGARIRVLDNMHSGAYEALMDLPAEGRYEFHEGDLLNPSAVRRALGGVDAVVHLAAIVHTPMGYENPTWAEQVNHWGTARLVEACLEAGVTRFVQASSIAVYGPAEDPEREATEDDACRPVGPYAQSKWHAEESIRAAMGRGLDATILRFGILFGRAPTTRFDAVANRFAYLAGVGRALPVHGDGTQRRPFIHARDASAAVRCALAQPEATRGRVFNAVGENASVLDVVAAVRAAVPEVAVRYTEQDIRTHLNFVASSARLRALGWQPQHTLRSALGELSARFCGRASAPHATDGAS